MPKHRFDCYKVLHFFVLAFRTFLVPSNTATQYECCVCQMWCLYFWSIQNRTISPRLRTSKVYYCHEHRDARNGACAVQPNLWLSLLKYTQYALRIFDDLLIANALQSQWPSHRRNTTSST